MTQIAIPSMTERQAGEHPHRSKRRPNRTLRRLRLWLFLWQRRRSERLASDRLRAEIADPRLMHDVGLLPLPPSHLERWMIATLKHRRQRYD
jgi:hypothetical protein